MPRTFIEIRRDSDEPLYRQIRGALEHGISIGRFDTTHRLPSSRELAEELGVSRNTVNLAYQELVAEGYITSRERRGWFVNPEMAAHTERNQHASAQPRLDWGPRMRRFADFDLPHVEKHAEWFDYEYPFVAGQVDAQAFPVRAWNRCLRTALYRPHIFHSLQDSLGSDDPMLVEMICRQLLPARGIEADPSEVLVTVGSQQGLDLLSRLLLGPGSVAGVEDPGYLDARHIFLRAGAEIRGLAVDGSGARPPASMDGIDLVYLTPSHHHPTNVTLSIGRRKHLLSQAAQTSTIVVEDDYDSEFRYHGSPTPALKALEGGSDVVYLGTFSKFMAPGLRLGYLVAPAELITQLRLLRRYMIRHPAGQLQRAMALLIEAGDYHRAVRRYRSRLMSKWATTTAALNAELPWPVSAPPGGVSIWISGPPGLDARRIVDLAHDDGILIERGDIFFLDPAAHREHFRVGFAAIAESAIRPGIAKLSRIVRDVLDNAGPDRP